jgi:TldD protein
MRQLLHDALKKLARRDGVEYADARVVTDVREALLCKDHRVERHSRAQSRGHCFRVLYRGSWGFAAGPDCGPADVERNANRAVEVARASAAINRTPVRLCPEEPQRGTYRTALHTDPFQVATERKVRELLGPVSDLARRAHVRTVEGRLVFRTVDTLLLTSEGTDVEQSLTHGSGGLKVVVERDGQIQQRCHPMDHDGGVGQTGYELVEALDFAGQADRVHDEALALLAAPPCPATRTTLILDTGQLALQIHESCGHPTEGDRALGEELSLAGGSFLTPDQRGKLQYGSPIVNLTADSLTPGGLGTFGWDDEGVPARKTPLVAEGRFVGYLTSRETAAKLGLPRSAGACRAEGWARMPIVRMINVSLEPGAGSLDDLVADTDDGILMGPNKSWSIDDLRLNFQFGCEIAWEVKHGRRGRILRNPLYTGITPEFWGGCDRIAGPEEFRMWGFLNCGKGDPIQTMFVGHGCAPARFRNVLVGAAR